MFTKATQVKYLSQEYYSSAQPGNQTNSTAVELKLQAQSPIYHATLLSLRNFAFLTEFYSND